MAVIRFGTALALTAPTPNRIRVLSKRNPTGSRGMSVAVLEAFPHLGFQYVPESPDSHDYASNAARSGRKDEDS